MRRGRERSGYARRGHARDPGCARRHLRRPGGRRAEPGARSRLYHPGVDRHAHAPSQVGRRCSPEPGPIRLCHGLPGHRHGGADAVQHGGLAQRGLGRRPSPRGVGASGPGAKPRGGAARVRGGRAGRAAGRGIYHPYISEAGERGPFLDQHARAQFTGLSQQTTFAGLLRGVYEGLSMAALDCYGAMGPVPSVVHVAGGVAKSRAVRTILASVLGTPVRTLNREEAGAAMTAAIQLGLYPDMAACAAAWVDPHLGDLVRPDPRLQDIYRDAFARLSSSSEAAKDRVSCASEGGDRVHQRDGGKPSWSWTGRNPSQVARIEAHHLLTMRTGAEPRRARSYQCSTRPFRFYGARYNVSPLRIR